MIKNIYKHIFPEVADNNYKGNKIALYVFILIVIMGLLRSCVHLFAQDGGAGSIAGINLDVAGASGIVSAFSLWGSSQLIYSLIQLVVFLKYKTLIPLMYVFIVLEYSLRIFVGHIKPVTFLHTPPGQIGNYLLIPLALLMLYLTFPNKDKVVK